MCRLVKLKIIYESFREGKGVDGRVIIEYSTIPPIVVPEPLENTDGFVGSGYGYGNAPQKECLETDPVEVFDGSPNPAPGVNTITLERDVLPFFDDDRVTASAFLHKYGFAVKEIDGEQRVVEMESESI
jgi:hypothetical protein